MATAKWEHLVCEIGNHKWKRELGKRGRKPTSCPKHKPTPVASNSAVTLQPNGMRILHCAIGDHDWEREPTRGRVPVNCPQHKPAPTIVSAPRTETGMVKLHCEVGNHEWDRAPSRGRKPRNCPDHSGNVPADSSVEKKGPGRPKKYENKEEQTEAQLAASRARVDNLEGALKDRGTHLSQQTPYILYKKVKEVPGRNGGAPTTHWDKVAEHSPLAQAQYINKHESDFVNGLYRYERHGKVVVL